MTLILEKSYKLLPELKENGNWVDIGGGASVKVAMTGNANHKKALEEARDSKKYDLQYGKLSDHEIRDLDIDVEVKTLFLDFRGIKILENQPSENSVETRKAMFQYEEFREFVLAISRQYKHFMEKREAGDIETLKK